jgi:hypothetical protein
VGKKRLGIVIDPCLFSVTFSLGYDDDDDDGGGGGGGGDGDNDVNWCECRTSALD